MYIYLDIVEGFACEMCGSCCKNNWLVTLSEESYQRNARLFAEMGKSEEFSQIFIPITDHKGLEEYAYIAKKTEGGCWFLAEDHRCNLQKKAGHDHLDQVCQTFPRYPMNTTRGTEITLSFSCPAVLRMASRTTPFRIIRSEVCPIAMTPNNEVLHVYPEQQLAWNPLRYYFEIEQHFIDLMQYRCLSIIERLQMIHDTVCAISCLVQDDSFSQQITRIFYSNYEMLDTKMEQAPTLERDIPDRIIENFFVNFIFKKPFYIYGLQPALKLMENIWQRIEDARRLVMNQANDIECTQMMIMTVELEYSHNRRALLESYKASQ